MEESDKRGPTGGTDRDSPPLVAGMVCSAGGVLALERFFSAVPEKCAMAFIVVSHLDGSGKSDIEGALKQRTRLPVAAAEDGMVIQGGRVYIRPPERDLTLETGRIRLRPQEETTVEGPNDLFLRSLARDAGDHAVGIVLSGLGRDGTQGIKAIKGAGGIVMVQSPESSGSSEMEEDAVDTGLADFILSPQKMVEELISYCKDVESRRTDQDKPETPDEDQDALESLFAKLKDYSGIDFSSYDTRTALKRLRTRMAVAGVDKLVEYVDRLGEDESERERLFRTLLHAFPEGHPELADVSRLNENAMDLQTLNAELKGNIEELTRRSEELRNLLESIGIPVLLLDRNRRIRRFTRNCGRLLNLVRTDINRPVDEVDFPDKMGAVISDVGKVIAGEPVADRSFRMGGGRRHLVRVLPHRNLEGRIEGAVLTFVDIEEVLEN